MVKIQKKIDQFTAFFFHVFISIVLEINREKSLSRQNSNYKKKSDLSKFCYHQQKQRGVKNSKRVVLKDPGHPNKVAIYQKIRPQIGDVSNAPLVDKYLGQ